MRLELQPVAEIVGAATFSQQPEWFTTAPVEAIRKLLDKVGWTVEQVDLFEINEAFAVVTMFAERELEFRRERSTSRAEPFARAPDRRSGARILVTLLHALRHTGGRRGSPASVSAAARRSPSPVEMIMLSSSQPLDEPDPCNWVIHL